MALIDHKITDGDIAAHGVQSQPDRLTGTAAENKAVFDKLIAEAVAVRLNGLIDELVVEITAKLTAPETEGSVGQYLAKTESGLGWDSPSGTGDMLKSVYDRDNDGRVDEANSALVCSGNAGSATKLHTARTLTVQDADGSHSGAAASFDGSGNIVLKLPATVKAALEGMAATAAKLATARSIGGASFDGSANISLAQMGAAEVIHGHTQYALKENPTFTGTVREEGKLVLKEGTDYTYGTELPETGAEGQLFFLIEAPEPEPEPEPEE